MRKRREFIAPVGVTAAGLLAARAQEPQPMRRVSSFIAFANDSQIQGLIEAFSMATAGVRRA